MSETALRRPRWRDQRRRRPRYGGSPRRTGCWRNGARWSTGSATSWTERQGRAGLFPTAGDRWLLDRLAGRLAAAEGRALDRIAAGTSRGTGGHRSDRTPLQTVEWLIAAERAGPGARHRSPSRKR